MKILTEEIQEENIPTQSHYTVAVADLDEVKNKLDKLKSKASSYGVNFNYNPLYFYHFFRVTIQFLHILNIFQVEILLLHLPTKKV